MYTLNYLELTPEELAAHQQKYGRYNDPPPGWEPLTEEQFAKSGFFSYTFVKCESRQFVYSLNPDKPTTFITATLYYMAGGEGYGMVSDFWDGKVHYFRFGCKHQYEELSPQQAAAKGIKHYGRCWHVKECKLCGNIISYDSGD